MHMSCLIWARSCLIQCRYANNPGKQSPDFPESDLHCGLSRITVPGNTPKPEQRMALEKRLLSTFCPHIAEESGPDYDFHVPEGGYNPHTPVLHCSDASLPIRCGIYLYSFRMALFPSRQIFPYLFSGKGEVRIWANPGNPASCRQMLSLIHI